MTSGKLQVVSALTGMATQGAPGNASSTTAAGVSSFPIAIQSAFSLAYGSTSDTFDTLVVQVRTLAASASETLNLFDGSVLDVFNQAAPFKLAFAVSVYRIANPSGAVDASCLTVGGAVSAPLVMNLGTSGTFDVYLNAPPFIAGRSQGYNVTNTAKNLLITNADSVNPGSYVLVVCGRHV